MVPARGTEDDMDLGAGEVESCCGLGEPVLEGEFMMTDEEVYRCSYRMVPIRLGRRMVVIRNWGYLIFDCNGAETRWRSECASIDAISVD